MIELHLQRELDHPNTEYRQAFSLFIEGFICAAEIFDVMDSGVIDIEFCMKNGMDHVMRHKMNFDIQNEKFFFQGSVDACRKIFEMLELCYGDYLSA